MRFSYDFTPNHNIRGHNFKLYKKICTMRVRSTFLVSVSSVSGIIYLPVWILCHIVVSNALSSL